MFTKIESSEEYKTYLNRYSLRRWYKNRYSSILSDPYYVSVNWNYFFFNQHLKSTPKKEIKKKENKNKEEKEDEEDPTKFDLASLDNEIKILKDQIVWFKKFEYKSNINYQIYYSGKDPTYSSNFFLHQVIILIQN